MAVRIRKNTIPRDAIPAGSCLCDQCAGKCCRYFSLPSDEPRSWDDYDAIRWYLAHGQTIVYVPYYMPVTQTKWGWTDQQFTDEAFGYIKRINPRITDADLIDAKVGRLRHAQPICEPNFANKLPPIRTPIGGLQIADTCYYYPEDRGVAESIRLGRRMAEAVGDDSPRMDGSPTRSGFKRER